MRNDIITNTIDLGRRDRDRRVSVYIGDTVGIKVGGNHDEWHGTYWAGKIIAHRTDGPDPAVVVKPVGQDKQELIPVHWIYGKAPGTKYLPGAPLYVDGKLYYVVNAQMTGDHEIYDVHSARQPGGKDRRIACRDGNWFAYITRAGDARLGQKLHVATHDYKPA